MMVLLILYMLYLAFQVNIKKHTLIIDEMKDGVRLRLFFISDIHRRKIPDKLIESLLGEVDIVVIGGDLTEKGVPIARTAYNLQLLTKLGAVYYVYGNNDREVGDTLLNTTLKENNIHILNNESVVLFHDPVIHLIGMNDGFSGRVNFTEAFNNISVDELVIFVSHAPAYFNRAKQIMQPRLLLAGHLHGGQIRVGPFGLYEKGSYRIKETSAELISNGFGTTGVPFRLGAKSECHVITLHGKSTDNNL